MGKHIAFLIMNFSNGGGTERVTSVIANNLSKRDYTVSVISCREGETSRFFIEKDIFLYSLHGETSSNAVLRKLNTVRELQKFVIKHSIDVVVAVDVALYLYLWPLQKKRLCKCVAWEHFNYYIAKNRLAKISRAFAAANADCVIVLGKNDLRNYKTHYKKINRIEYVYNPIALSMEKKATLDNKRVLSIGRLSEQKGFDLLLDAWKIVEGKNTEWTLDIFGEGALKETLQQQIDNQGLKNAHLRGYVKDIEEEYVNSSIFALSSRYEGFVLVLMEAQAKALPCVSFNCKEGPDEIIDDGVNGYLVEEGNVVAFAERLLELMNNKELRDSFSKKARKNLKRFDTTVVVNKWERILESL